MDKSLLSELKKRGNLRVFPRSDLLKDLLRTFRSECRIADQCRQPVLLVLFGHGDKETCELWLGCRAQS